MFVNFPRGLWPNINNVFTYMWRPTLAAFLISVVAYLLYFHAGLTMLSIETTPISVLGVALSIFLGFRNNSAYDRWWEARKIWGGIVNESRTTAAMALTMATGQWQPGQQNATPPTQNTANPAVALWQKAFVYRHLAWLNALRLSLRRQQNWQEVTPYLNTQEQALLPQWVNKPTQILHLQFAQLTQAHQQGYIDNFRHIEISKVLRELFTLQGRLERIKNTPFLKYYDFFTRVFLWLFATLVPFAFLSIFDRWTPIMSTLIVFVFVVIERTGRDTEEPLEEDPSDIPMSSLCRTIEIDLRQMLGETDLPQPLQPIKGVIN